jgi:hypothetical protein
MAMVERCIPRPFDTAIRDVCHKPAEAFVEVHFRLIADCMRTPSRHNKTQHFDSLVLVPLMLYRFWQFQTGCGLPWFFSGFNELEDQIARDGFKIPASVRDIVQEMKEHDRTLTHSVQQAPTPAVPA